MERRAISIQGTVQGVGFRPFVYALANSLRLGGFVRNHTGGVEIQVEGEASSLEQFMQRLLRDPPPLARIVEWSSSDRPVRGERLFRIEESESTGGPIVITPDAATCDACLAELFDPQNRRYRYPFLNCTRCGPRLTIVTGAPYDRQRTTMAKFIMCADCRREYEDPADRRFHAQPSACPACGPTLSLHDASGALIETDDPLGHFEQALRDGKIGAMKGLGGYHLVADARRPDVVAELRQRKHRDEKPLAIMVRDLEAVEQLCHIDPASRALLTCNRRPIVLLRKRAGAALAEELAPRNPMLGIMLPYTPLHHLLLHDIGIPLVMTSGNRTDEPIAYEDADAIERLSGIADLFLSHNRPIHVRCDDSVTRLVEGEELPIRRSRGCAPQPIALPFTCDVPILAVGGQMKGTFAMGTGSRAILSQHMGDLDHFEAFRAFERDIALYGRLFAFEPICIAHDLHPDYASTRYAQTIAREKEQGAIRCIPVQHHHAHMASCMAEHGLTEPVIAVTFDGTGYGTDGAIWGGEILVGDYRAFRRFAHLRYVAMPGGEKAVREPWRMALSHLADAGVRCASLEKRLPAKSLAVVRQMIARKLNSPPTSSAGRLFDAVASLANVRDVVSYEGQAAVELEALAMAVDHVPPYPVEWMEGEPLVIDTRPLIRAIAADVDANIRSHEIAKKFHACLVEIICRSCNRAREMTGGNQVVVTGGVFMNALLSSAAARRLAAEGFFAYRHRLVPCNDGGISLGQLAIAASQVSQRRRQ